MTDIVKVHLLKYFDLDALLMSIWEPEIIMWPVELVGEFSAPLW